MHRNLSLTEREKKVLCLLFENKVMTRKQIANEVFPNLDKGNLSHRLCRILNLGFVRDFKEFRLFQKDILYELTDDGFEITKKIYEHDVDKNLFKSYAYLHDIGLVKLRQMLQGISVIKSYYTENVLQNCPNVRDSEQYLPFSRIRSDAVIELRNKDSVDMVALEYEPSVKSYDRYRQKILDYYVSSKIQAVLYVCECEKDIESIIKVEKEIVPSGKTKLYFALFKNVFSAKEFITFVNRNNAKFEIKIP